MSAEIQEAADEADPVPTNTLQTRRACRSLGIFDADVGTYSAPSLGLGLNDPELVNSIKVIEA